ncbi:hypothetical protein AUQ37_03920 [Candidatus Methanomethylophilus sp. 1R26]|uniref:hypothetical protein n=1 Tax=Candidatus Methanomethylophilus sp. 1R26 TaxID=1769296 RepID=UPI0007377BEE|nr:hypothetical protein [Candidatus Methanomethylophilus sp. 1R26]KUE73017.1 hypothetical protein AUQ37_03920 [Candidatus Methanomethylophilus sp. 1R26]MEE3400594.1 hypothetical protein [Methanomethylophilus sp.]
MTLGPTAFILEFLKTHSGVTSRQICDAYSEHLGHRCNHASMTTRLKMLSMQQRIVRGGMPGRYIYSGVKE